MEYGQRAAGSDGSEQRRPLYEVALAFLLAVSGLMLSVAWAAMLFLVAQSLSTGESREVLLFVVEPPALLLGVGMIALAYFAHSRHDSSFLDVRTPGLVGLGYAVVGTVAILGLSLASELVIDFFGVPSPEHGTVEMLATADPLITLYFVGAAILFIGPAEELLFRNLLQKRLAETFSWAGAIGISSVIFAIAHTMAYLTGHTGQFLVSLTTVFLLSLLLGYIYHRTENLVVVALAHGGYDAVVFLSLYAERIGYWGS